ncbi:hypothetical protein E1301_Tti023000 [Triplophysa tibetana]|uniref:SEA domain-containing protein n=1 Tax=Triplophysa tibetana TaxID=1572043 RepID=A0A5A9NW63_9TELE|nr:hypothetical protein E1301_Tti023000 [Triplophysa tibetana]
MRRTRADSRAHAEIHGAEAELEITLRIRSDQIRDGARKRFHSESESGKQRKKRSCSNSVIIFIITIIIILILTASSSLIWYFIEYRVWVLEARVIQQYTASVSILNHNFTTDLSNHLSSDFTLQSKRVQNMVEKLVRSTDLSRYFNSTLVFAFGDGSLVAHFWLILSVPSSQRDDVSVQRVNESLYRELQRFKHTQHISWSEGLQILPSSLSVTDCYHYKWVDSTDAVILEGPNSQRSSCLWHLRAPAGSRLELRLQWLLTECRDRLIIYDSLTPTDSHLITS